MFLLALGIMNSKINHISYQIKMYLQKIKMKGEIDKMAEIISSDNLCSKHLCVSCQQVAEMLMSVLRRWSRTWLSSCGHLNEEESK